MPILWKSLHLDIPIIFFTCVEDTKIAAEGDYGAIENLSNEVALYFKHLPN